MDLLNADEINYETESRGHSLLTPDFSKWNVETADDADYVLLLFVSIERFISYKYIYSSDCPTSSLSLFKSYKALTTEFLFVLIILPISS